MDHCKYIHYELDGGNPNALKSRVKNNENNFEDFNDYTERRSDP